MFQLVKIDLTPELQITQITRMPNLTGLLRILPDRAKGLLLFRKNRQCKLFKRKVGQSNAKILIEVVKGRILIYQQPEIRKMYRGRNQRQSLPTRISKSQSKANKVTARKKLERAKH